MQVTRLLTSEPRRVEAVIEHRVTDTGIVAKR